MVQVLGVPFYSNGNTKKIAHHILGQLTPENLCISATGAHGLVSAKQNPKFATILNSFYINLPDGMPGVWIGKLKGAKNMTRCYGPDFFRDMMTETANQNYIKHFFCGGNNGVAEKLKISVLEKFKNPNIVGTFCPPFLDIEQYNYPQIAKHINNSGANIVWIGLSSPKQEQFAYHLSKHTNVAYICCVGAAFDFHIDALRQAPKILQKCGLEWLFRLIMEPKRLWKRYIQIVPLFIYYNFAELLTGKFFPKKSL